MSSRFSISDIKIDSDFDLTLTSDEQQPCYTCRSRPDMQALEVNATFYFHNNLLVRKYGFSKLLIDDLSRMLWRFVLQNLSFFKFTNSEILRSE